MIYHSNDRLDENYKMRIFKANNYYGKKKKK